MNVNIIEEMGYFPAMFGWERVAGVHHSTLQFKAQKNLKDVRFHKHSIYIYNYIYIYLYVYLFNWFGTHGSTWQSVEMPVWFLQ